MAKTFLQVVNGVMDALRRDQITTVSQNRLSRLATLYANQVKELVEDACLWRTHRTVRQVVMPALAQRAAIPNTNERSRLWDIPGHRPRCYDITENLADSTQPYDRRWNQDIDVLLAMQNNNVQFTFDVSGYFTVDVNNTFDGIDFLTDVKTFNEKTYQVEVSIPQADFSDQNQGESIKVPTLPIIYGATYMATQERGEELGIDGGLYKELYTQSLRDAVSKEVGEQGGWNVEADYGRFEVLRRQF